MKRPMCRLAIGGLLSVAFSASAAAQDAPAAAAAAPEGAAEAESPFSRDRATGDDLLGRATAREDLSVISETTQTSSVTNGTVTGTTNGDINFSDNAFQNATGLTVINANSGNNVAMNASITVNVVMTAPQ